MEFLDARRLTGPSLLFDGPAAVLDVAATAGEIDEFVPLWERAVRRMLTEFDWPEPEFREHRLTGGVSVAFTVPIDSLYAASMINEWAYKEVAAAMGEGDEPDYAEGLAAAREAYADEVNPGLLALEAAAAERGVSFLWDDDEVSLGLGKYSTTWPVKALPAPAAIDWSGFGDVPIGIVTGTNGKTTTVRLAQHILMDAGQTVGLSSTDWIAVDHDVIDRGDWSGPGGARTVLRQPGIDTAVLEAARGGLLRRGLGVYKADAALITNISEDHLGDFGSQTVAELLDVKWVISRAVRDHGRLVLNADDARLVEKAKGYPGEIVWFSTERHDLDGLPGRSVALFFRRDDELLVLEDTATTVFADVRDIPLTMQGIARHNVANALAAAALTWCLGASLGEIGRGLASMSQDENPGRCNLYELNGRRVLIDFAHNPAAMQALFAMAESIPAARRVLCFGQAGDRPDSLIEELTRDAFAIGLERVIVSELAQYHRGRERGDVYRIIRGELLRLGMAADGIDHHEEELESLDAALAWAAEGDLVIMLALGASRAVRARLVELGARPLATV
ncbi:MAG: Mur ligase family protein [Woeseiaceae bacterium]|jgi:UDP-N-acetylmuramyl tripeptide synthase|nr:Mur ligase family protein [Woeseiaceae bacterium]